jgi:hypothetical protein
MSIPDDVLESLTPQPYARARRCVRDGDLLLCSADDRPSRLIRWATRSRWSHIAIAFRIEEIDRVIVLESVEKYGVRAVPLSSFISRTSSGTTPYPGRILLARHDGLTTGRATDSLRSLAGFAFDRLGDRFAKAEVFKIFLRILLGRFDVRLPNSLGPDDEFICSEYVARCYAAMGVEIRWDGLGFIAPGDFALDPALRPVAQIQTR